MADLEKYLFDGITAGDLSLTNAEHNLSDSISADDEVVDNVFAVIADSVKASETIDFLRNILHLTKRIFTLRLRR